MSGPSLFSFIFDNKDIKVYGTWENPLFKAHEIAEVLEIKKIRKTLENIPNDEKILINFDALNGGVKNVGSGNNQSQYFITEFGLYRVCCKSRKEKALEFSKKMFNIIREVRLNNKFELSPEHKQEIERLKSLVLKQEAFITQKDELINKQNKLILKAGIRDKNKYPVSQCLYVGTHDNNKFKIGISKNLNERLEAYRTHNPDFQIIYFIQSENAKEIETILKSKLKPHSFGDYFEWISDVGSDYIINLIKRCDEIFDTSVEIPIQKEEIISNFNPKKSIKKEMETPIYPEEYYINFLNDRISIGFSEEYRIHSCDLYKEFLTYSNEIDPCNIVNRSLVKIIKKELNDVVYNLYNTKAKQIIYNDEDKNSSYIKIGYDGLKLKSDDKSEAEILTEFMDKHLERDETKRINYSNIIKKCFNREIPAFDRLYKKFIDNYMKKNYEDIECKLVGYKRILSFIGLNII